VNAAYRASNAAKEKVRHRRYQQANKAKDAARMRRWRAKNRKKVRAAARAAYSLNKESENLRSREYHRKNAGRIREQKKLWRSDNVEQRREYEARYLRDNKAKINAKTARRRAALMQAMPSWANPAEITAIYANCRQLTETTGVEHHVDHIVPLRSRLVCGLHWEKNLQVITGSENSKKCNSWWPDMP